MSWRYLASIMRAVFVIYVDVLSAPYTLAIFGSETSKPNYSWYGLLMSKHLSFQKFCPFVILLFTAFYYTQRLVMRNFVYLFFVDKLLNKEPSCERHHHYLGPNHLNMEISSNNTPYSLIARFIGPTLGPSGADMTQVGPMLAPWTLLSGLPNGKTELVFDIPSYHEFCVIFLLLMAILVLMRGVVVIWARICRWITLISIA